MNNSTGLARSGSGLPVPREDALGGVSYPAPAIVSGGTAIKQGFFRCALALVADIDRAIASVCEYVFGVLTLIVALAILAAVPILQFLSLGYLLEAGGRIGRTGRFREGFIGVRKAARVGSIVLGTWLMLLPLRIVSSLEVSAQLIDPDGPVARQWRLGLIILTIGMTLHIVVAWSRGGK